MVKDNSPRQDPVSLADILREIEAAGFSGDADEARKRAADALAARNLLRGAVEHHLELKHDPQVDPAAVTESRQGVFGDEANLLAADPEASDVDTQSPTEP